jgi:hypothetical protein
MWRGKTRTLGIMRGHFAPILFALIACAAQSGETLAPSSLLAMINEKGARAVIDSLWGTTRWDTMIKGVASGDEAWLKVAVELAPGSDAGSASELRDAVAWALPHAPARVIAVAEQSELFRDSCSGPPVDFPSDDPKAYFGAAISAVQKVTDPALKAARQACLTKLRLASRA